VLIDDTVRTGTRQWFDVVCVCCVSETSWCEHSHFIALWLLLAAAGSFVWLLPVTWLALCFSNFSNKF
jgi:hypothetical protein